MNKIFVSLIAISSCLVSQYSIADIGDECWVVSNLRGYSAFADNKYKFETNGLTNRIVVCFGLKSGTVSGTDIQFVKFGKSTLAGYGGNDQGNEMFEVYQLDRANMKMLYTKTRVGTKTITQLLSDTTSSFVGNARKLNEKIKQQ